MSSRMSTISVAILVALTACASQANYERLVNSWQGLPGDALIAQWGPPDETVRHPDGQVTYTWIRRSQISLIGSPASAIGNPVHEVDLWCRTRFTVDRNEKVAGASWEGNNCVAGDGR